MAKASGRQEQSGRDLVFQQWFEDNIVPAGNGAAIEEAAIYKAYRGDVHEGTALGRQGVHRMLNELGVRRSVRVGKPMRLNVGFKLVVGAIDVPGPGVATPEAARRFADSLAGSDNRKVLNGIIIKADERDVDYPTVRAVLDLYAERRRQVEEEGFDAAHDDASDPGAHERAAATYAYAAGQADHHAAFVDFAVKAAPREGRLGWIVRDTLAMMWPWSVSWWKPKTDEPDWQRACLVKAGALILAAIERRDRAKARAALEAAQAKDMTGV